MSTRVVVTGTGNPRVAPGRAGAGVLVAAGDVHLQFDAGRATTLRLAEAGVSTGQLTALFVTHHHSDHLVGLQDVVMTRWIEHHRDHVPLTVVAPSGPATDYVERMLDPWGADIRVRQDHVGRTDGPQPEVVGFDAPAAPTPVWADGDVSVTACVVHHEPVTPSVGYRVDTSDGAVVISGDTRVCDEIAALSRGAAVLVHEVFCTDLVRNAMQAMPHLSPIAEYHADLGELARQAGELDVSTLVLTHLIPPPRHEADERHLVDEIRRGGFGGQVIVARDLSEVTLP